jgi:hypothetical protein
MANQPEYMLSISHAMDQTDSYETNPIFFHLSAKNDTVAIISCERPCHYWEVTSLGTSFLLET